MINPKVIQDLIEVYNRRAQFCDQLFRKYSIEGNVLAAEAMSSSKMTYGVVIDDLKKILKGNQPRDDTNLTRQS